MTMLIKMKANKSEIDIYLYFISKITYFIKFKVYRIC